MSSDTNDDWYVMIDRYFIRDQYVRRSRMTYGPLTSGTIASHRLANRLNDNDKVSQDGKIWEPLHAVPQMIHEELLDMEIDWRTQL